MTDTILQSTKFAYFDQDSSTFNSVSENNSVKYKLEVRGSNSDSSKGHFVKFNGTNIGTLWETGLNVKVLTETGDITDEKVFFGRGAYGAMHEYLKTVSADKIVVMLSVDRLFQDLTGRNVFESIGAVAFPLDILGISSKISYAAIYLPSVGKVVAEGTMASMGEGVDSSAYIEKVYDTISDIATTGIPQRVISDLGEYFNDNGNTIKQWPSETARDPMSKYHLRSGDMVWIQFEAFRDGEAAQTGGTTRFYHNYYKDGVYVSGYRMGNLTKIGEWEKFSGFFRIPDDVNEVETGVFRFPQDNNIGRVGFRNLIIAQVSGEVKTDGNAAIGVNGVRATDIKDNGTYDNPVMNLLNLPLFSKLIDGNNIKEFSLTD